MKGQIQKAKGQIKPLSFSLYPLSFVLKADPAFFKSSGPFRGYKRDLYDGGIRVPMIVRQPGTVPAGVVSDYVWAFWDFLPTAAELAGGGVPKGLDGMSVVPTLTGEGCEEHEKDEG